MIVLRLLGLLVDLLLLPIRWFSRRRAVREGSWLALTIDGAVADITPKPRFWDRRERHAVSLHVLERAVTRMLDDARIAGIVVTLRSLAGGMATASSLREQLWRAREGGKRVVVHLPFGGDSKEVFVASAATTLFLGPTAQLSPFGFRAASRYVKRALDQLGLEPQIFARGEFKSAGESLVRDSMSAEQRAQLERLLDSFHDALTDAIASGRRVDRDRARALIDEAPWFGKAAVEAGLADDVAYEDEVRAKIGAREPIDIADYVAFTDGPLLRRVRRAPIIAVIPVHGTIAHTNGFLGQLSTDERVTRMVRAARKSRRVRGVVLHIDSPGGSAIASDLMHHEIAQLAREKPVVACMANVAASGGYYVAAPCVKIVAQPLSITGSIGVVAARFSAGPLLARLGITTEIVSRGARAELLSASGPLSEDARATILREIEAMYRSFVGVVAAGRSKPADEIEKLARGRVYTGLDARDVGLVDVLGGFDVAVAEVKKLMGLHVFVGTRPGAYEVSLMKPPRSTQPVPELPAHLLRVLALFSLANERALLLADVEQLVH